MNLQKIYSKAQRSRTPVPPPREASDSEEENSSYKHDEKQTEHEREVRRFTGFNGGLRGLFFLSFSGTVDDDDSRQEAAADDADSNSSVNENFDAKLSRASSLYQGPTSGQSVLHH